MNPNQSNWRFSILAGVLFTLVVVILGRTLQHQVFSFGEPVSALEITADPARARRRRRQERRAAHRQSALLSVGRHAHSHQDG